jgi:hypothetical protein
LIVNLEEPERLMPDKSMTLSVPPAVINSVLLPLRLMFPLGMEPVVPQSWGGLGKVAGSRGGWSKVG